MKVSIDELVDKSKEKIKNTFFKIIDRGGSYDVIQYNGQIKPLDVLTFEGWNRHPYLKNYITVDYPTIDVNDFKSEDGITIIKKSEDDIMKDSFKEIIEYYNMNHSLIDAFRKFKIFVQKINVDFMKFSTFNELISYAKGQIDSFSISANDKASLIFELAELRISIFEELEKMNIESPLKFLSRRFKYFLLLLN